YIGDSQLPPFDTTDIAKLFSVFLVGLYLLVTFAGFAGRLIVNSIDRYMPTSYVNLNRGYAKLISELNGGKKGRWIEFFGGSILTVILGIASSKLATLISF